MNKINISEKDINKTKASDLPEKELKIPVMEMILTVQPCPSSLLSVKILVLSKHLALFLVALGN